jgi:hypothetical protein
MVLSHANEYNIPRLWRSAPARDGETQQKVIKSESTEMQMAGRRTVAGEKPNSAKIGA